MQARQRWGRILGIICLAAGLAVATGAPATGASRKQTSLMLATSTPGGTFYPMGVGMAALWSIKLAHQPGIMVQAIASAGSGENLNMLRGREVELAILQGMTAKGAWLGLEPRQGAPVGNLRSICMLWPNVEHFLLRKDKIKTGTPSDVKGLAFAIGRAESGQEQSGQAILEALGVGPDDLKAEYLGYNEAAKAMAQGSIDGANLPAGPPAEAVAAILGAKQPPAAILEFSDKQLAVIAQKSSYPPYRYVIPAGTYPGQDKDVRTIAQANLLAVREDVPEDVVYLLTKTLMENPDFMRQVHPLGAWINPEHALDGLPVPLHPGALRYYREKKLDIPPDLVPAS